MLHDSNNSGTALIPHLHVIRLFPKCLCGSGEDLGQYRFLIFSVQAKH